jgi:hypothetical protein
MLSTLTIQMRSCHNALNPVVHLPESILHQIMTEVVIDAPPRSRLFLGQVCSHWRTCALNMRNLWSAVDLQFRELSREYLSRSDPLPVDVKLETTNDCDVEDLNYSQHLDVLAPHVSRVRTLSIHIPGPHLASSLKILCSTKAPYLESLIIRASDNAGEEGVDRINATKLFMNHTPNLREVSLRNLPITWEASTFSNLKTLRLDQCTLQIRRDSENVDGEAIVPRPDSNQVTNNLLDVLSRCPSLEALHLGKMSDFTLGTSDSRPLDGEIVQLPCLKALSLHQLDSSEIKKLLWRLSIPPLAQLSLNSCLDESRTFEDCIPPLPHHLANLYTMKSLSVSIAHRTLLKGTLYSQGGPTLFTADFKGVDRLQNAEDQVRSIRATIPFEGVQKLSLVCKHAIREVPESFVENLLKESPALKYLSVYGAQGRDILRCLSLPQASESRGLDHLEVTDVALTPSDISAFLSKSAQMSRNQPTTKLVQSVEFTRCPGITDSHVQDMRQWVPEVMWDGEGSDFAWPKSTVASRPSW